MKRVRQVERPKLYPAAAGFCTPSSPAAAPATAATADRRRSAPMPTGTSARPARSFKRRRPFGLPPLLRRLLRRLLLRRLLLRCLLRRLLRRHDPQRLLLCRPLLRVEPLVLCRLLRRPPPGHLTVPMRQLLRPNPPCYLLPAACALRLRGPGTTAHPLQPVPPHPLLPPLFLFLLLLRLLPKHTPLLLLRVTRGMPPAARAPLLLLNALHLLLKRHALRPLTRVWSRQL